MVQMRLFALLLSVVFLVAGCDSLPKDIREKAKAMPERFNASEQAMSKKKAEFQKLKSSQDYKDFLIRYSEKEKWDNYASKADRRLNDGKEVFEKSLKPIIDRNESREEKVARTELSRINVALKEADDLVSYPVRRGSFILKAKNESGQWQKTVDSQSAEIAKVYAGLNAFAEGVKSDYPAKKDDIVSRMVQSKKIAEETAGAADIVKRELEAQSPDYSMFADNCDRIGKNLSSIIDQDKRLRAKLGELSRSYSKTLVDMRVDYYVQVGRVSWEESELIEWPTETTYDYAPRLVDESVYEYFEKWPEDDNVGYWGGFFSQSFTPKIDPGMWGKLKIDPKEKWPSGDNDAEYYLVDIPVKYYHKYLIVENGEKTETDWVEVDEASFDQNDENIGMDLVAKPFGLYEEEAIKVAAPPGMAYVGNPKYGSWKNDANGGSFWEFYGKYRLFADLLGPSPYYRRDWDDWNSNYRGKRPYYGEGSDERERYGSGSAHAQTRYAGSHYSKTGGFKSEDTAVRGAGQKTRSGGPGGGGK